MNAGRRQVRPPGPPGPALVTLKVTHTVIWFSVEACMAYLIYAGLTRRADRRAAVAGAVVGGESLIFLANGARCPLTGLARSLGAERGSVTDVYLPGWLAHNLPAIHVPLAVLAVYLHVRNIRQRGGALGTPKRPRRRGTFGRARQAVPRPSVEVGDRGGAG